MRILQTIETVISTKKFDLKIGDKIMADNLDTDLSFKGQSRYKVLKIYPYTFLAEKTTGNHRQVGFAKADYLCGRIKRAE